MKGRRGKMGAQWHLFPKKRGNSLGVRLWNWAVNAWPIDRPDPETGDRNVGPDRIPLPPPPLLSDPLVDAVTSGKSSDNGQKCRQYFDRFVRPFFSAHRPSKVCAFRRKKFDGTKKSLNRSINGREKKMEIERAHRACENFISQRTGKDNKEEGEWIYLTFGDL